MIGDLLKEFSDAGGGVEDVKTVFHNRMNAVLVRADGFMGNRAGLACGDLVGRRIIQRVDESPVRHLRRPVGVKFGRST